MSATPDRLLLELAEAAGLLVTWRDAYGHTRHVEPDTLRSVLAALDVPCSSEALCRESLAGLRHEESSPRPPALIVVKSGAPMIVPRAGSPHYRLHLENGKTIMGTARAINGANVAIPGVATPGYHHLEMGALRSVIAVVPPSCPSAGELSGRSRPWVVGAQIYSLRRRHERNATSAGGAYGDCVPGWEIGGDFTAVGRLARNAAEQGAAGLAISPVHAMFSADPSRYSPYSPSSRLFLNAMYADPAALFDGELIRPLLQSPGVVHTNADGCMDWPALQRVRLAQLRKLYDIFCSAGPAHLAADFDHFRRQGAEALAAHACYEALHAHHAAELGAGHGWRDWKADYQNPDNPAVQHFAREHESEVGFHAFLQWLAARGMADTHAAARAAGMPFGLIADMAVGTDPRGSHAWSRQAQIMSGVSVGAPPDIFQPDGQNWGLTAFSPRALRQLGYEGFIGTLRAVLAHAGGVRVDHVLGLARMWLVPEGAGARDGVYLRYPREDLMDLLVLEAWRHQAVVVGENLGTVPEDFSAALDKRGILGMSVLWFQQEQEQEQEQDGEPVFMRPDAWPPLSMSMVSTHDLPTLRGWWLGRDIQWRERLGQFDPDASRDQRSQRESQKQALWAALQQAGEAAAEAPMPADPPVEAVLAYVARTPAALFSLALEDLAGEEEQPNLPSSSGPERGQEGPPNWSRILARTVDELFTEGEAPELLERVRRAREKPA